MLLFIPPSFSGTQGPGQTAEPADYPGGKENDFRAGVHGKGFAHRFAADRQPSDQGRHKQRRQAFIAQPDLRHDLHGNGRRGRAGHDAADIADDIVAYRADPVRTFLAAMEWKGCSSAEATATPTISNRIPTRMMSNKMTKAMAMPERAITAFALKEIRPEITMVLRKMVIAQRI